MYREHTDIHTSAQTDRNENIYYYTQSMPQHACYIHGIWWSSLSFHDFPVLSADWNINGLKLHNSHVKTDRFRGNDILGQNSWLRLTSAAAINVPKPHHNVNYDYKEDELVRVKPYRPERTTFKVHSPFGTSLSLAVASALPQWNCEQRGQTCPDLPAKPSQIKIIMVEKQSTGDVAQW